MINLKYFPCVSDYIRFIVTYAIEPLFILGGSYGQDPFGGQNPFGNMNADDIFKSFFGQFGGQQSGFDDTRTSQVCAYCCVRAFP